jgi:hypothetical protein
MTMNWIRRSLIAASAVLLCGSAFAGEPDYSRALENVGRDIAALKREYPQLSDFSVAKNVNVGNLRISYQYRTHKSDRAGGWAAGVPNPDQDGVWFYIDFHDADSTLQIHTQPAMATPVCLGDKRVSFLSLEGTRTKKLDAPIWTILRKYGAKECDR